MFLSFGVLHWQSFISRMVETFERLSEELFSMYTSVLITVYDVKITKSKRHNEKPRN